MPPPMEPLIVTTADLKGEKQVSSIECHNFILNNVSKIVSFNRVKRIKEAALLHLGKSLTTYKMNFL